MQSVKPSDTHKHSCETDAWWECYQSTKGRGWGWRDDRERPGDNKEIKNEEWGMLTYMKDGGMWRRWSHCVHWLGTNKWTKVDEWSGRMGCVEAERRNVWSWSLSLLYMWRAGARRQAFISRIHVLTALASVWPLSISSSFLPTFFQLIKSPSNSDQGLSLTPWLRATSANVLCGYVFLPHVSRGLSWSAVLRSDRLKAGCVSNDAIFGMCQ